MQKVASDHDFSNVRIPSEAEDLHTSKTQIAVDEDDQPHLFMRFPKEVWVHVYSLLNEDMLFISQAVCVQWRNLINQPFCWYNRAIKLREGEAEFRRTRAKTTGLVWDSDDGEIALDDEVSFGSGTVAALKRECKMLFIRKSVREQNYEPKSPAVVLLLQNVPTADSETQECLWREAWELEPCGKIAFERARHFENLQEYEKSVKHYLEAVKICPYDHAIRTRLGLTYHKWGKLEEALRNYLKTAALVPGYQLAWNNAGSIFFNTGFYERAEKCFSRCISLDNRAAIAFNNRGLCHFLRGDGANAVADFTTAYSLNQGDKSARSNRAAAFNLLGDYKLAVEDCVEELSRIQLAADEVALPYLNKHLGYAYLKMGETEKAIVALSAAIEIKRDFRQAYDLLEEAYTKLGDMEKAKEMKELGAPFPAPCGNNESIFSYYLR